MNEAPENFEALQKLLALKRHEVPPPGYFNNFSEKIIARIEAQEMAKQQSWWRQWLTGVDAKPVLAGAYAAAIGGLFACGLGFSQMVDADFAEAGMPPDPWLGAAPLDDVQLADNQTTTTTQFATAVNPSVSSSLNPVVEPAPNFLFQPPSIRDQGVERASAVWFGN